MVKDVVPQNSNSYVRENTFKKTTVDTEVGRQEQLLVIISNSKENKVLPKLSSVF